MKKILFFIYHEWAFGSLHYSLIKELYKHNIYADLLTWTKIYTTEEFKLLIENYDSIVTTPDAAYLIHLKYEIPLNKIIAIAHEQWDLYIANKNHKLNFLKEVKQYSVISKILVETSKELGIERIPKITPAGICFNNFYRPVINKNMEFIGYAGAKQSFNYFGIDRKRGFLVEKIIKNINDLKLINHNNYSFMCMPSYYHKLDCVIISSIEDAGGLPSMEAAACGKLVISTPVGYFEEHGPKGGGITVPIDTELFIKETTEKLIFYKENKKEYIKKCEEIQEYAKKNYDWSCVINYWLDLFKD